jgi:hypothetical protein
MSRAFEFDLGAALDRITARRRASGGEPADATSSQPSRKPPSPGSIDGSVTAQPPIGAAVPRSRFAAQSSRAGPADDPSLEEVSRFQRAGASTFGFEHSGELRGSQMSQMSQMSQVAASCRATRPELTAEEFEEFEERAAIVEFDGGLSRTEAERLAFGWIVSRR